MRENIEWMNMWWSQADDETDRCLLIGDSVTRALRSNLEIFLKGRLAVDLYASSFAINDAFFWKGLSCFCENNEYRYNIIVLNYGFHHGYAWQCSEREMDYVLFKDMYERLVDYCYKICDNIVIVNGSSVRLADDLNSVDWCKGREIVKRNDIVKDVARNKGCKFFDLYTYFLNSDFKYTDWVHLEARAYSFAAMHMMQIFDEGKNDANKYTCADRIRQYLDEAKEVVVYGIGDIGHRCYLALRYYCPDIVIKCWTVSKKSNIDSLYNVPIIEIEDIKDKDVKIIIASSRYEEEMYIMAKEKRFTNICFWDFDEWTR